jgi:MoaE-MoaD fusion protein
MKVKVLFFANLKDAVGEREITVELPAGATVGDLKAALSGRVPALKELFEHTLIAVNKEYVFDDEGIPEGAEVSCFPPVSGGSGEAQDAFPTVTAITSDELNLDALLAQITLPSTGAAAIFTGMVRGITRRDNPHTTAYLEYEAYQPMAEAKMRQVADEIRQRWPTVEGVAIVQRVGKLYPETPTVLIACTAAHRDTGVFEAAHYGIDRLKEIVPVWKKEVGSDGEAWVEGKYIPHPGE